jgi:hypothetical protein
MTAAVASTGSAAAYPGKAVALEKNQAEASKAIMPSHRSATARGRGGAHFRISSTTRAPAPNSHARVGVMK